MALDGINTLDLTGIIINPKKSNNVKSGSSDEGFEERIKGLEINELIDLYLNGRNNKISTCSLIIKKSREKLEELDRIMRDEIIAEGPC